MNKNKFKRWFDREYFLPSTLFISLGIFFVIFHLSQPVVKSNIDLQTIQGKIHQISFKKTKGFRNTRQEYYLWLTNYSNSFKIKADFINISEERLNNFKISTQIGEEVRVQIPKSKSHKLNTNDYIFIFSLETNDAVYLSSSDTIKRHNSNFLPIVSFGFIAFGTIYFFVRRDYLRLKGRL